MAIKMKVAGFQSGSEFVDGRKRVDLRLIDAASFAFDRLRVPIRDTGILGLVLDDVVEVTFTSAGATARAAAKGADRGE